MTDDDGDWRERLREKGYRLTPQRELILGAVERLGLVRHAHLSDRAPTYHATSEHEHFHLVCRECHKIISVDPDVLTPVTERLAADHGFTVDIGHLTVFGTCGDHGS